MPRLAPHHHLVGPPRDRASRDRSTSAVPQRHRESSAARVWSKTAISRLVPSRTLPAVGRHLAGQHLQQRGLADPVRPDKRHPVAAQHLEIMESQDQLARRKPSISLSPRSPACPKPDPPPAPSPRCPDGGSAPRARPAASASARTRPWLRLRRAEMPSTAQRASALDLAVELVARRVLLRPDRVAPLLESRQSPAPAAAPRPGRSTASRAVSARRKARSWLIITKAARVSRSRSSSQPIA